MPPQWETPTPGEHRHAAQVRAKREAARHARAARRASKRTWAAWLLARLRKGRR